MLIAIVIFLAVAGGLFSLLFRLLRKPIKWGFKLLLHVAFGFVTLFTFNIVGSWVGLGLPVNWITAAVSGVLGIPGVILLLVWQYIL